ncbi:hypothetical protein Q5M85_08500 [Paraclostridium bifermentans]|nr:hypothetical protein [Paraclostridium bifermentans]
MYVAVVTSNALSVINSLSKLQKIEFDKVIGQEGHIECIVKDEYLDKAQLLLQHFQLAISEIKGNTQKI